MTTAGKRRKKDGGCVEAAPRDWAEGVRRRTEDWPTEHTEHTEGFLTGGNGEGGGRRAEGGGAVPNPRAGKPVPRGLGFPAHVGAEDGSREGAPAHSFHLITDSE